MFECRCVPLLIRKILHLMDDNFNRKMHWLPWYACASGSISIPLSAIMTSFAEETASHRPAIFGWNTLTIGLGTALIADSFGGPPDHKTRIAKSAKFISGRYLVGTLILPTYVNGVNQFTFKNILKLLRAYHGGRNISLFCLSLSLWDRAYGFTS